MKRMIFLIVATRMLFVGAVLALLAPAGGVAQITWTNHSTPVLGPGPAWASSWVAFASVIDQDSQYVMWYSGADNTNGVNASVGRATSSDGLNWTKDTLNPVMQHGSSAWDAKAAWIPKVLKIGNAYTMWYTGSNTSDVWQIGRATSTDGRVWVRDTTNPVIRVGALGQWDAALVHTGSVLFDGTTYRMWYTGLSQGYAQGSAGIGLATSTDGIHWIKDTLDNPVLAAGPAGAWDQHGVGECSVVYDSVSQRYLMFYDGNELDFFQETSGIGYASSADGIHWVKYAGNPVLPNNLPGSWTTVASAPFVLLRDSTFHMWYAGEGTVSNSVGYATSPRVSSIPTAGLQLWLRADAGVDTLNGTVSRWHDQSGNGNDAIQSDTARQPFLQGNAFNGKPALGFDGVNDRLSFTGTTRMSQFSIFIVQKIDSGAADEHYYYPISLGDSAGSYGLSMRNGFSDNSPDEIDPFIDENSWVRAVAPGSGCAAFGKWKIISVSANTNMWNTTMHVDGVAATITPQGGFNTALSVPLGTAIYSEYGGLGMTKGNPLPYLIARCHVAEVLVYSSALSDSARQAVESYLATNYGSPTGISEHQKGSQPERYVVEQNYPNPFNPTTTIGYDLPKTSHVLLVVFNTLGQRVATLVDTEQPAGRYQTVFDGKSLASGVYFCRMQAGNF
ncbi:MAG: T9SS type A sorting domain-containing protein, partial [Bacteroidota bacterium]